MSRHIDHKSAPEEAKGVGSLRWVRLTLLVLMLALLVLLASVAAIYCDATDTTISPAYGYLAAALTLALLAVVNSQVVGSREARLLVPRYQQLLLGAVMTVAQVAGGLCLYGGAREVLRADALSSGMFLVALAVSFGFAVVLLYSVWHFGSGWMARTNSQIQAVSAERPAVVAPSRASTALIGWRFWIWLAAFGGVVFFVFGLVDELAPYPLIGVSKGVYLTTLYVLLFALAALQCGAMHVRRRK